MSQEENNIIECFNLPNGNLINKYDTFDIKDKAVTENTHIIHKYPSKFIPQIPRWAILEYSNENDIVLDPFSGSGTTVAESLINNRNGIGIDINPVARLISKVKSTPIDPKILKETYRQLLKNIKEDNQIKPEVIPNIPNIDKWFTEESIKNLSIFKYHIYKIEDPDVRDFFKVNLSAIIRKTSNAEYRSQKTYVSSRFRKEPDDVFKIFDRRFNQYLNGMEQFYNSMKENEAVGYIIQGSADNFDKNEIMGDTFDKSYVDLAITSPPYVTAVEYPSVFKLEYQWLDYFEDKEINEHRKNYIGTDRVYVNEYGNLAVFGNENIDLKLSEIYEYDKKKSYILYKYLIGMKNNMQCVYDVLKTNGKYVIVVGNNSVMNIEIPISEYLIQIGEEMGYELENIFSYVIKDRHLIIPRNGRGGIINKDWVIVLNKK
ncbi:MAG: hypothetical protein J6D47_15285 [Peptostreptococcaceae bacterium]|nr:hypothetical protein [Peptostreptococcaceae bacterium]